MLGEKVTQAVLDDYQSAPIGEKLRATLGFLKKVTLAPDSVDAADARAVLDQGVSRTALEDALYTAYCFNTIDRIADALGFAIPSADDFAAGARALLARGYEF